MNVLPFLDRDPGMLRRRIEDEQPPTGEPHGAQYSADIENVMPPSHVYNVAAHREGQCRADTAACANTFRTFTNYTFN